MQIDTEIIGHLSKDSILEELIDNSTLPVNRSDGNIYHDLLRSITGQQLSVKVAQVIYNRLLNLYDGIEPNPQTLASEDPERLRAIGYSRMKAKYIINVAEYFKETSSAFAYWSGLTEIEVLDKLTSIKGVGKWTAQMVMIFTLEKPDIMPVDDYGIQVAMQKAYNLKEENKELKKKMLLISEKWRPYRTIACRYLWSSLNNTPHAE